MSTEHRRPTEPHQQPDSKRAEDRAHLDDVLAFLPRLNIVGDLLAILNEKERMFIRVEELNTGRRLLLNLSREGLSSELGGSELEGEIGLAATTEDLQLCFLGRLGVMEGINQRRLLLSGGMCRLIRFFPILELVPALYAEHLDQQEASASRSGRLRRALGFLLQSWAFVVAWLMGRLLRGLDRREALEPLKAMARGVTRFHPRALGPAKRRLISDYHAEHPLALPAKRPTRKFALGLLAALMGAGGFCLSLLKHRLGIPINLFRLMGTLSRAMKIKREQHACKENNGHRSTRQGRRR